MCLSMHGPNANGVEESSAPKSEFALIFALRRQNFQPDFFRHLHHAREVRPLRRTERA